jgi:hypothetical protein
MDETMCSEVGKSAFPAATMRTCGIQFFRNEYIPLRQPRRLVISRDEGMNNVYSGDRMEKADRPADLQRGMNSFISVDRMAQRPDFDAVSSGPSLWLDWEKSQSRGESQL